MRRWCFFLYGIFCHLLFLGIFAYLAGFVGNLFVPLSIDSPSGDTIGRAMFINLALVMLFGLQHSVMARPWFKRLWTRLVPEPVERSTYCLLSCIVTFVLIWQWRGMNAVVWNVEHPAGRALLWALFAAGWLLVPAVSLMIHHFDLFGTRQVWLYFKDQPYAALPFRTPMLYRFVRHPLYLGWTLAFWATPTMTLGHLLFASSMTLYMVVAAQFEERDLVSHYGDDYREYQQRVPMFFPRLAGDDPLASEFPVATIAVREDERAG